SHDHVHHSHRTGRAMPSLWHPRRIRWDRMRKTLIARVGVGLAVAVAVVLAVVLLDPRSAGDVVTGDLQGIQVSVATPGSTGAGGPGPGNGDAEAPTVTPSETPAAGARGIHVPDVLLAFTAA